MARKYKPYSLQDLVNYHVNLYYIKLSETKGLRLNHKEHLNEVEIVNRHYHKALSESPWDNETNQHKFHDTIDFLTGVYTKEKEIQDVKEWKKRLMGKN